MAGMSRILLVDDDRELCSLLATYLEREGFTIEAIHDADALASRLEDTGALPDLIVLDVMMPGQDGLSALRELRRHHSVPVIMLSGRGEPIDRVVGLELGADDYLSKPCLPRELLARVRAQLRRPGVGANAVGAEALTVGTLRIDPFTRNVSVEETPLTLTGAEFSLLLALARSAGQVVDKARLTQVALGRPIERFDRSVDVHVSRLRRKLSSASGHAPSIEAVRGVGYVLTAKTA
jgi:two-component system response regulator CpxR